MQEIFENIYHECYIKFLSLLFGRSL